MLRLHFACSHYHLWFTFVYEQQSLTTCFKDLGKISQYFIMLYQLYGMYFEQINSTG